MPYNVITLVILQERINYVIIYAYLSTVTYPYYDTQCHKRMRFSRTLIIAIYNNSVITICLDGAFNSVGQYWLICNQPQVFCSAALGAHTSRNHCDNGFVIHG